MNTSGPMLYTLRDDEVRFLQALADQGGTVSAQGRYLPPASNRETHNRQRLKQAGFVTFASGKWSLTDAGRASISEIRR